MKKKVSDSRTEQTYLLMQKHLNGTGRLFGGILMQWIDELAGIVARRHSNCEITTVAIDNLSFRQAAYLNQAIVLVGRLTYVGKTSMEIRVDTYVEGLDGVRKMINHAYAVMVAIDQEGKPLEIPELIIETETEWLEWENGKKRYELRKKRRRDGY